MSEPYKLRGYTWPTRLEGHGDKPSVSAYPNQGLAIDVETYDHQWLRSARACASLARMGHSTLPTISAGASKYPNAYTPLGAQVAHLTRTGGDMLSSSCGNCCELLPECRCDLEMMSG